MFGLFSNRELSKDANFILKQFSPKMLEIIADLYEYLLKNNGYEADYIRQQVKPVKDGYSFLQFVANSKGNLKKMPSNELYKVASFEKSHIYAADILHHFIDHHNDAEAAKYLYSIHNELHDLVPKQYDNELHVIEVLIEHVRNYQWLTEHFVIDHFKVLEDLLGRLVKEQPYVLKD